MLLRLPAFLVGDPLVDDGQLTGGALLDDAAGEAQRFQTRERLVICSVPPNLECVPTTFSGLGHSLVMWSASTVGGLAWSA
ncbi:hypothetical protein [Streptomyces sp. NPDC054783]